MKRIASFTLSFLLAFASCFGSAFAEGGIMPLASPTIMGQSASMKAGATTGELRISYNINAKKYADEVGVLTIELYNSDGSYADTITGTVSNGLIRTSSIANAGTYSYTDAVSGQYYYAVVTLYATIGSVSDSVEITTATVKAP